MHVSPLLLGLAIATTSATAAALPRGRARGRTHSAPSFLKLRSPPPPAAERFVILPEDAVQATEKRDVAPADVYRRPTAADDSAAAVSAASVPVSTDSIDTSSGKNTQPPNLAVGDSEVEEVVSSLVASVSSFETFTYSNYGSGLTTSSSAPAATSSSVDPVQEAIQAAESYANKQKAAALPTVTVNLVLEPTQEADGTWDYVVKVGADGTATASPTWIAGPTATASATSSADYYVPTASSTLAAEPSAPVETEYYYGNTHTWNGTSHFDTDSESTDVSPVFDATIRALVTTSSHFAFQCADATSYYYSETSDATQVCPGGTVCRYVNTACSPCVWPDQDIWCAGNIYPFLEPSYPTTTEEVQPTMTTQAPSSVGPTTTSAPTYVTGSGYHSASGETGRGAVTFTYTSSNAAVPTAAPVTTAAPTTEQAPTSYSTADGSSSVPAESTAWTSGHGGQHSYPWMTESAATTMTSVDSSAPAPTSVEMTTTLSNGVVIETLVPTVPSSAIQSASTTVNSWLVEATKGIDPIQGGSSSASSTWSSVESTAATATESISATVTPVETASVSATEILTSDQATSTYYATEPSVTAAPSSGTPSNETVPTWSNVETATATESVFMPTSTQSANDESATPTLASSSSGILVPSSSVGNGTDSVLPTASVTSQASEPALTASASASITDPTDNGIATETVTDWDIVNATSTTYVPYETASATATYTFSENATVSPTASQSMNDSMTSTETASAQPTVAFTSSIVHQWPANETLSATESASSSFVTESASSSSWESIVTASASGTSVQPTESATSSEVQSTESVSATATSSAAESTETATDEDECEEWEEVWVDEEDIQPEWIVVE